MKNLILFLSIALCSFPAISQDFGRETGFSIPVLEVEPSLSLLAPEIDLSSFSSYLTPVNFYQKPGRPRIDMVALMKRKKWLKEQKSDFETPLWAVQKKKNSVIEIAPHFGIYSDNINYNPYTGKILNPAFEEARPDNFIRPHTPFAPSYYRYNPRYSPFFR